MNQDNIHNNLDHIIHSKIILIDYGLACKVGDTIYLNKDLLNYPELYKALKKHEKKHSDTWNKEDLIIDFKNRELKGLKFQFYKFILTHPKSWITFLPIWRYGNKLAFDPIMFMIWLLIFLVLILL